MKSTRTLKYKDRRAYLEECFQQPTALRIRTTSASCMESTRPPPPSLSLLQLMVTTLVRHHQYTTTHTRTTDCISFTTLLFMSASTSNPQSPHLAPIIDFLIIRFTSITVSSDQQTCRGSIRLTSIDQVPFDSMLIQSPKHLSATTSLVTRLHARSLRLMSTIKRSNVHLLNTRVHRQT